MTQRTPFFTWVAKSQPIRLVFIHLVLPALGISLLTDRPTPPWDIVGWLFIAPPAIGYWVGNYWYWVVRLKRGTVQ